MNLITWLESHGLSVMSFLAIIGTMCLLGREVNAEDSESPLWHGCRVSAYVLALVIFFTTLAGFLWCEWTLSSLASQNVGALQTWAFWLNRWTLLLVATSQAVLILAFSPTRWAPRSKAH